MLLSQLSCPCCPSSIFLSVFSFLPGVAVLSSLSCRTCLFLSVPFLLVCSCCPTHATYLVLPVFSWLSFACFLVLPCLCLLLVVFPYLFSPGYPLIVVRSLRCLALAVLHLCCLVLPVFCIIGLTSVSRKKKYNIFCVAHSSRQKMYRTKRIAAN